MESAVVSAPSASCTTATTSWPQRSLGRPGHDHVGHGGMARDGPLDLLGEDLLAARVDRDRVTAEQQDLAVGQVPGPVAGDGVADPVDDGKGARRLLGVAQVAQRHRTPTAPASRRPRAPAGSTRVSAGVDHHRVGTGDEGARRGPRRDPLIWAPVSEEPTASEMYRLGRRARASSRTAGLSGAPPLPTANEGREVVLGLVELHDERAQDGIAHDRR